MDDLNKKSTDETVSKELEAGISTFGAQSRVLVIAVVAAVALVAVWITKSNEVSHIREEAQKSSIVLRGQAKKEVVHSHEEHIRLLTKPLVWALSGQLQQGNLKQAESYIDEILKEDNFELIAVVDPIGKIILTTNKKLKGEPFSKIGAENLLKTNRVSLENRSDKILLVTCPITGKKGRLGTLFIKYKLAPKL